MQNFIWNPIHLDRIRQNRMYGYVPVYASTGILVQYVLVCTAMYQKHDMRVSHTCRQLFESKLKQHTAPMQEIC